MYGDETTQFQRSFEFQIFKCQNDTELNDGLEPCATPEEIDEYISKIEVQYWAIYDEINFAKYVGKPTNTD